jgi:hypothetical protein
MRGATASSLLTSILDPLNAEPKFCGSPLAARRLQFAIAILSARAFSKIIATFF